MKLSACDIDNPAYERSPLKAAKYRKGFTVATIYRDNEDDYEQVAIHYEAEDTGDGYNVQCERPEVLGASDVYTDVLAALHEDGLADIARVDWL